MGAGKAHKRGGETGGRGQRLFVEFPRPPDPAAPVFFVAGPGVQETLIGFRGPGLGSPDHGLLTVGHGNLHGCDDFIGNPVLKGERII